MIGLSRLDVRRKGTEANQAKGRDDKRFTALVAFRVVGVLVLGLLAVMALSGLFNGLDDKFATNLLAFILFTAFILLLGPFWPSEENLEKWAQNSKFNLPTDNPAVALYVLNFCAALFSLYMAWSRYAYPPTDLWRHEKVVLMISGQTGLVVSWLVVALGCFTAGVATCKKAKQKKKRSKK